MALLIAGLIRPTLGATDYSPMDVILRLVALVGAALLLIVIALWLRKRLLKQDESPPMGFTLRDLRAMHAAGQLSDEELAKAEATSLARSRSHYMRENESGEKNEAGDERGQRLGSGSAWDALSDSDAAGLRRPGDASEGDASGVDNEGSDGDNDAADPDKKP